MNVIHGARRQRRERLYPGNPVLLLGIAGRVQQARVTGVRSGKLFVKTAVPATSAGVDYTRNFCDEGKTWVRGWEGEIPDAFRARIALLRE